MAELNLLLEMHDLPQDLRAHMENCYALIEQVHVFDVSTNDTGLQLNHPNRPAYFKPGEWTQTTCKMRYQDTITSVWLFRDKRIRDKHIDVQYKLAFDAIPQDFGLLPFLTQEQAKRKLAEAVLELVGAPYKAMSNEEAFWSNYHPSWIG